MKASVAIKTIGTGLAYEKSTSAQVKSAGGELLRLAPLIAELETLAEQLNKPDKDLIQALRTRLRREPTEKEIENLFDIRSACGC